MAIIERIAFGVSIKPSQILGMIFIVAMSILLSLSDLFGGAATETTVVVGEHMPIYQAVLYSMSMPVVGTFMTFIVRYANKTIRLASFDFSMAFVLVFSWVFLVLGVWQWTSQRV